MSKYNQEYWQDRVDEIMDWFDFEKVSEVMLATNWQWGFGANARVPEKQDLKKHSRRLLRDLIGDPNISALGTGGFKASIDRADGVLTLQFIVEEWDAYEE